MAMDPAELLAGPRGRRLCLEFLLRSYDGPVEPGDRVREAIFYAAYELDHGRGSSRVLLTAGAGEWTVPPHSPADVARLLEGAPIRDVEEENLLVSLAATVDSARYWQEPDGEDVLAESPDLQAPLARVAAAILDSPHASWWAMPAAGVEQWTVAFSGLPLPRAASAGRVEDIVDRWRADQVAEEVTAERERPSDPAANWSGTWWSRPPGDLVRTTRRLPGRGPVGLRLVEDAMGWESATVERVSPAPGARVLEIDGPAAWADLCGRFPLEVTAARRHDWYRATGRDGRWVVPDWSRVARHVDAVHLSMEGYLTTAGRAVPVGDGWASVLAGWDPDHTFWLSELRRDPASRRTWRYDRDDDDWAPVAPH
jgi:hypothetical protein